MASRTLARRAASVALNRFLVTETSTHAAASVLQLSPSFLQRPTCQNVWDSRPHRYFGDSKTASGEEPKADEETIKKEEGEPKAQEEPKKEEDSEEKGEFNELDDEELLEAHEDEPAPSKEEQLEAQVKDLKHQLLSSLAEQENVRRIAKRDVADARDFAIKSFAKSLLDVADNLERALEAVPPAELQKKENRVLSNLFDGIRLTHEGLMKAFANNGLTKFGQKGELFDPNRHEALYEYPSATRKPGTIGKVLKSGYKLNKRVLRSAEVGVIKEEEKEEKKELKEEET